MIKSSRVRSAAAVLALSSLVAFSSTSHAAVASTQLSSMVLTQEQVSQAPVRPNSWILNTSIWRGIVNKSLVKSLQLSSVAHRGSLYGVALPGK